MAIQLTITEANDASTEYVRRFLQDRIVIGRARSSDVCLPDLAVSTRHTEIRVSGNEYVVVDLDSMNGTLVNGKPLTAFRPRTLKNGDTVSIANFCIIFQLGVGAGKEEPRETSLRQAHDMVANVLARSGPDNNERTLMVVSGPHRASRYVLPEQGEVTIGRGRDVDIALEDRDVAVKHAALTITRNRIEVRDASPGLGIVVANKVVASAVLTPGDRFTVGKTTIALEHPAERCLGVIFDTPEEDTSSFSMARDVQTIKLGTPPPTEPPVSETQPAAEASAQRTGESSPPSNPPEAQGDPDAPPTIPVGPADPLVPEGASQQPVPASPPPSKPPEDKTDLGLILIGALIVLAAVAALAYLYS